ncbi:cyclopropane-fatty-acyl-phospholipid synthase family protein [Frankia sp. AgB32]|uniref:SAM-dependent methyltransferase n=1 Tax=Frankia sp. AgB32 TaxID=631119 RepID=UPI00200C0827|nr:class I SAM-dependent methyltransferase [Frankia sp. AgB32]MCK9894799.1 methyltransferase domain-containing protein [Frankia sp. AgB32]
MSTNIPSAWYADFFTCLPNEFWRRAATPEWTAADVAFVETRLGLAAGSRILDVPCDSGRHSLALAARGYQVTGVDLSAEAIGNARRAAASRQAAVTFEHRDMRDLAPLGVFDAAVCLGNSFCYLDPAGTRAFVAALGRAVRPGGGLVIDVGGAAESVLPGFTSAPRTMHTGDITVESTTEYDVATSRLLSHYRFAQGSRSLDATAVHHVWTSGQLGALLAEAGFVDLSRHGDPDGTPFVVGSGRLFLVARRE